MKNSLFDADARMRTVSLTLNVDLYAKAKAAGINVPKVAEEALAKALAQRLAKQVSADIRRDSDALNAFIKAHGSFAEMVRDHYAGTAAPLPSPKSWRKPAVRSRGP